MGRSTKRNVAITNVSTNEIKDVFNSDSSSKPIPDSVRKASEFFVDGDTDNSIYENFIDPNGDGYCTADEGETKKDKFTRTPRKWSYWKNYGGKEEGVCEIPEIYWSSGITENNGQFIPQTPELTEYFNDKKLFPVVSLYPDLDAANNYINAGLASERGFAVASTSILHRSGSSIGIGKYKLATNIGADYPGELDACGVPEFKIKITPYINGERLSYTKLSETYKGYDILAGWSAALTNTINDPKTLSEIFGKAYDWSFFNPSENLNVTETLGNRLGTDWKSNKEALEGLIGQYQAEGGIESINSSGSLVQGLSTVLTVVTLFDMIWDAQHPASQIADATYQYQNVVVGNYNFNDISSSTYRIAGGNKHYLSDSLTEKTVTQGGGEISYSFDSLNYGDDYDVVNNKINSFPNNSSVTNKFLNFDFDPICNQYDLNVPPAIVEYLVELVPVRYCTLSPTKTTAFLVKIMPDLYKSPKFSMTTSAIRTDPGYQGAPALYYNTSISFRNSKYVDFILFKDEEIDDEFLGIGGQYYDVSFNTDGNLTGYLHHGLLRSTTFYPGMSGNDTVVTPIKLSNNAGGFLAETGLYSVYFMQEKAGNLIFNPNFRLEKDDNAARRYAEVRRYWNYGPELEIRGGAIYKDNNSSSDILLSQSVNVHESSIFKSRFYTLQVDCNIKTGSLYLVTADTCFRNSVYSLYSNQTPALITNNFDRLFDAPENFGMLDTGSTLEFANSGSYYIVLQTLNNINSRELTFKFSSDFTGNISKCKLQYLSNAPTGEPSGVAFSFFGKSIKLFDTNGRSARNAITYYDDVTPEKVMYYAEEITEGELQLDYDNGDENLVTYAFDMVLPPNHSVEIVFNYYAVTSESESYDMYDGTNSYSITVSKTTNNSLKNIMCYVTNHYSGTEDDLKLVRINSLTCNDSKLHGIYDNVGMLEDSDVDLSNSGFGYYKDTSTGRRQTIDGSLHAGLKEFKIKYNSLDISGTNVEESVSEVLVNYPYLTGGYTSIIPITEEINVSNTDIGGTMSTILTATTVLCENTNIIEYGSTQPTYGSLINPYIVWKNTEPIIPAMELGYLVAGLYYTSTENGYLDIAGDNPEIVDEITLTYINEMINDRGWNILYNAVSIPVITLVGDNPLTWALGETFIDPEATAYDSKDGDITSSIITTNNVDVNTEGTYFVIYNVTDSDGNPAKEVSRVVNVAESSFPNVTIGTQTWMSVNLDIDDDGDGIYSGTYGKLYTWDAAVRVAASIDGYHLPTDAEWITLTNYLGGASVAGGKLKEVGTIHWYNPNIGATNETGFTALPGGSRYTNGAVSNIDYFGYWWSATESSATSAYGRLMHYNSSVVGSSNYDKEYGFSVRLIKD